jgi:hypothetical protein
MNGGGKPGANETVAIVKTDEIGWRKHERRADP